MVSRSGKFELEANTFNSAAGYESFHIHMYLYGIGCMKS